MRKEELEFFLGTQMAFEYNGPDLPGKKNISENICGTILSVGIDTFEIEFSDGEIHILTNKHIQMKTPTF